MSRSNHPTKRNITYHFYWKFFWAKHGPASIRRTYNRIDRAKEKAALRCGLDGDDLVQDPPRRRKYISWIYW